MKKITSILAAALALALVSTASIAATPVSSGTAITTTDCPVLGESVKLNLSANVKSAYSCTEATNKIVVAACNTGGSRSTSLKCAQIGVDSAGVALFNDSQCTAANIGATVTVAISYKAFAATNTGGSVGEQGLAGACTDGTVGALPAFAN